MDSIVFRTLINLFGAYRDEHRVAIGLGLVEHQPVRNQVFCAEESPEKLSIGQLVTINKLW